MVHFELAGCQASKLDDDLVEAQEELASLNHDRDQSWELLFSPKQDELPKEAQDIEPYRLSAEDLKALGEQVTDLRALVKARVGALKAVGHVSFVPDEPLRLDQATVA